MRALVTAGVAAVGLLVVACSSPGGGGGGASASAAAGGAASGSVTGDINVFAAASLTESFTALGKQFEAAHPGTKINLKFDASSTLATQITQGNPADVFASASPKYMDSVVQAGDAVTPTTFVSNTMEIATPPGNPGKVRTINDLAKQAVKVALCEIAVPCGATAQKVFDNAKITVTPVTRQPDVKSTLAQVELKEVDAGVVYVTDVRAADAKVTGVAISPDVNASTTYPISVMTHSQNMTLARAWLAYVLSGDGQKVLRQAGFSAP